MNTTPDDVRSATLALIERVLQVDGCDPAASFFELGGSSLGAIQLITLVARELEIEVTLTDLFDAHDIDAFASLVSERAG